MFNNQIKTLKFDFFYLLIFWNYLYFWFLFFTITIVSYHHFFKSYVAFSSWIINYPPKLSLSFLVIPKSELLFVLILQSQHATYMCKKWFTKITKNILNYFYKWIELSTNAINFLLIINKNHHLFYLLLTMLIISGIVN